MDKIKVYHFHNGTGGGVLSVIRNLLQFSSCALIENHVIHTINKNVVKEYTVENLKGAASEQVFYYSQGWNFHYTCTQLAKLLPDEKAVIVTHDWLELGMVSNLGLQNPVVTFLHGDYVYYYQLAQLHQDAIDTFVTVAGNIEKNLQLFLPSRENDIVYLRFPVPGNPGIRMQKSGYDIAFVGRLSAGKGYHILPSIESILKRNNIQITWHIIGKEQNDLKVTWDTESNTCFYGNLGNEKVNQLLLKMDFFILPSIAEGMPVTLVEAMKAGAIPLVNNIDGGIQELVVNNHTGYKIESNEPAGYAKKIIAVIADVNLKKLLQHNARDTANSLFDEKINTKLIEEKIINVAGSERKIKPVKKIYGSRLDKKWVPNSFTSLVRSLK